MASVTLNCLGLANSRPLCIVQAHMPSILSDLRYAARELRRRPGFALTAIVSLALGIGATSAVFSVVYGVLIDPFPYVGAERIMQISLRDPAGRLRGAGMSGAQIDQLRQARTVESVVAEDGWNLTTTDGDIPEDVSASYISPNAPNHWGTPALLGRWLVPADAPPGQDPQRVVVLGYQFWQRYYSGDPTVVGRTIQLVRKDYQIVGVMPPRFRWREADIYVPLKTSFEPNIYYGTTLKLKPGVAIAEANAELQPILQEFAKLTPTRYPDTFRVNLRSIVELFARPMGPKLYFAPRRRRVAAARRLRQRLDPAARARNPSPAGARGPRRAWRRPRPNRPTTSDRSAGDCASSAPRLASLSRGGGWG